MCHDAGSHRRGSLRFGPELEDRDSAIPYSCKCTEKADGIVHSNGRTRRAVDAFIDKVCNGWKGECPQVHRRVRRQVRMKRVCYGGDTIKGVPLLSAAVKGARARCVFVQNDGADGFRGETQ